MSDEMHIDGQSPQYLAACLRRDQKLCKLGLRHQVHSSLNPSGASGIRASSKDFYHFAQSGTTARYDVDTATTSDPSLPACDLEAALRVLEKILYVPGDVETVTAASPLELVISVIKKRLSSQAPPQAPPHENETRRQFSKCYICRFAIKRSHSLYYSLCEPCGLFNLAESSISLPSNLNLHGKIAVVTGGRVNLGFHCALRLLRCGARTVVSTRYPLDAERRYRAEVDFDEWSERLRIVGADFRTARDAFGLVAAVKNLLGEQGEGEGHLYLLVNNAAQTLTDSLQTEETALVREAKLREQFGVNEHLHIQWNGGYMPRVRGGITRPMLEENARSNSHRPEEGPENQSIQVVGAHQKSSWVQSLSDIPYEDMITAHSVNAFVPFILCRELLPLMGAELHPAQSSGDGRGDRATDGAFASDCGSGNPGTSSGKPLGYIVNVSSREGIFELCPGSRAKGGHHVHTNMSKAALNMLTETEASRAWNTRRVAMNSVDPGYMSAAPEFQKAMQTCPLGFPDGVARVLWPVAIGETQGRPIWGRFLKHFGTVEVEVGSGR